MQEIKQKALEVLKGSTAVGSIIHLPEGRLDTEVFSEVKDALVAVGAKYNKLSATFKSKDSAGLVLNQATENLHESLKEEAEQQDLEPGEDDLTVEDIERITEEDKKLPEPKKEKRTLRYDFTAIEVHDLSQQLAGEAKKLQGLEQEKSSVVAQYGAKIKESKATLNKLSNLVADGWEFREVEVEIFYHQPTAGMKTIVRQDTNKANTERMESWEYNLFNQPV